MSEAKRSGSKRKSASSSTAKKGMASQAKNPKGSTMPKGATTLFAQCDAPTYVQGARFEAGEALALAPTDSVPDGFRLIGWTDVGEVVLDMEPDGRAVFRRDGTPVEFISVAMTSAWRVTSGGRKTPYISRTFEFLDRLANILDIPPGVAVETDRLGRLETEAAVVNEFAKWRDMGGSPENFWAWFRRTSPGLVAEGGDTSRTSSRPAGRPKEYEADMQKNARAWKVYELRVEKGMSTQQIVNVMKGGDPEISKNIVVDIERRFFADMENGSFPDLRNDR